MINKKTNRIYALVIAAIMLAATFAGCASQPESGADDSVFTSFRDIPGVSDAEIAEVEELQSRVAHFTYAANYSTEAFHGADGVIRGYTALICDWLSELFEIPFVPRIAEWDELIDGLEDGTIDFTGELTANEERRRKYFMTDDIAQRQIIYIRPENSTPLQELAETRPLRFAFLDGATTVDDVREHETIEFIEFFVDEYSQAFEMLMSGEVDAFFEESTAEAAFDFYGEVAVSTYFPIIYSPVSLATQNPEFEVIIDVVQKALENGAIRYLTRLYNHGHQDYLKHKLSMLLTEEEHEYIRNNPVIPYAAETTNYPVSFFDSRSGQWEGIALDVILQMERLTGLTFERQNDENAHWPELYGMFENGEVALVTELIPSENRIGIYLWPDEVFFKDYFVLISKSEFPDIAVNEILYVRTGVVRDTAHGTLFKRWFPNHRYIREFGSSTEAFDALERGEIDVVMTSEHQLLILTNYRELIGYRTNFTFDFYFGSTFGFYTGEEVLASIVTKAMRLIDIDSISGGWLRRTYDYRVRLAQERILFFSGVGLLSLGLVFTLFLALKKRKEGQLLETLVDSRTKELSENQSQLRELLRRNELQLLKHNLMAKATKIGLWDMEVTQDDPADPDNNFVWSDEFRNMLGFTDENDFPNKLSSWSDRVHPDDKTRALNAFGTHLLDTSGKTPFDLEYRLKMKNGDYAYFRASGETIRDENGKAVRVAGALLDITETKNLLFELETESSTLQTMFDSLPDLIFCKDTDLNYTRCNESLLKYFDVDMETLIGTDDEGGLGVPAEIADEYKKTDKEVINEGKILTFETYVTGSHGKRRLFEMSKLPLLLNDKVTGLMGIAHDITERKAMEEAAQSANKAKSEFLASMSHEIRTPMNAIIGMSEILEHEELAPRQMGYIRDISISAHALLGIINDILDMSKIEAGKLELNPVDYNFDQFIDNTVSMFSHVAGNKGLEFFYEAEGEIPDYLFGDDIRLRQVLTNICGNSIKFTESGHIRLSVAAVGEDLVFKVEDTGPGIRKDDIPKLFKAFEQVDKNRNRNIVGTGLGLPICKSFVEMMGGKIAVESEYGRGATFIITLPKVPGNPENISKHEALDPEYKLSAPDARILVTDDNEFNLKVAYGLLSFMDIEAEMVDSGAKAIELVKQNDYDIIFMDHMMPEMDGIETTQKIREIGEKYRELTIIALTANAVKGAREMFLANGFNDFIAKPIDSVELSEIVRKYLPTEKVKKETGANVQQNRTDKEDELFRKAVVTFAKENQTTSSEIDEALKSGDVKTAHRLAHTLKSSAGFLGRKALQDAAFSLEQSLQSEPAEYSTEQLNAIDSELKKALSEFEPMLKEAKSKKSDAVVIESGDLAALLAELKPLLEKGDFAASGYVEKLESLAGMEELAERIDEYDFEGALKVLYSLEKS